MGQTDEGPWELRDVATVADVAAIVEQFYEDMESDHVIGRFFVGLDWTTHLPRMNAFWSATVFQTGAYHGRPLELHAALDGLDADHFARWLQRWRNTVDVLFAGERAELMKTRAEQIGGIFQVKLGIYPDPISYPRP